jgi:hypothetical protein
VSRGRPGKAWVLGMTLLVVGGCASKEIKVSCDGRLQPINAPGVTAKLPGQGGRPSAVAQAGVEKSR